MDAIDEALAYIIIGVTPPGLTIFGFFLVWCDTELCKQGHRTFGSIIGAFGWLIVGTMLLVMGSAG